MSASKVMHIIATDFSRDGEVVARFADGTFAVFQSEELEKLRPRRKDTGDDLRSPEVAA